MILTIITCIILFQAMKKPKRKKRIVEPKAPSKLIKLTLISCSVILVGLHFIVLIFDPEGGFVKVVACTSGMLFWSTMAGYTYVWSGYTERYRKRLILLFCVEEIASMRMLMCVSETNESDMKAVYVCILIVNMFPCYLFWKHVAKGIEINKQRKKARMSLLYIDEMNGHEFEVFCAKILENNIGFESVRVTKGSGDFGADIVATDYYGNRWVWQCKKYSSKLTNKPIQEVVASKAHYKANRAGVITNSLFTDAAVQLAKENEVYLIDRREIANWL